MPHSKPAWLERIAFDVECFKDDLADPEVSLPQAIRRVAEPRARLGWAINDAGLALLRLSTRLCAGCPSSFDKFFDDGWRLGQDAGRRDIVQLMVRGDDEVSVVGRLMMDMGMDPEAIRAHLEQKGATR